MSSADENLFETMIRVENKDIFVDLKKNRGGVYLKISERNGSGRNTVLIPASGIHKLRNILDEVSKTSAKVKSVSRERLSREAGDVARSLYVSGLSWDTTDEELWQHFSQAGTVTHAVVLRQRRGGNSRTSLGCGIVEYSTVDMALNAINVMNDTELKGRKIRVREDRLASEESSSESQAVTAPVIDPQTVTVNKVERPERVTVANKVFVSGLAWEVKSEELAEFFSNIGQVVSAEVKCTKKGAPMGSGTVEYSDSALIPVAITQLSGQEFKGRKIIVRQYIQ